MRWVHDRRKDTLLASGLAVCRRLCWRCLLGEWNRFVLVKSPRCSSFPCSSCPLLTMRSKEPPVAMVSPSIRNMWLWASLFVESRRWIRKISRCWRKERWLDCMALSRISSDKTASKMFQSFPACLIEGHFNHQLSWRVSRVSPNQNADDDPQQQARAVPAPRPAAAGVRKQPISASPHASASCTSPNLLPKFSPVVKSRPGCWRCRYRDVVDITTAHRRLPSLPCQPGHQYERGATGPWLGIRQVLRTGRMVCCITICDLLSVFQ